MSDNVPEGATGPGGAVGPDNPGRDTGEGDYLVVDDLPALIVKGRKRFEDDIRNARIIGKFVVTHGQRDITERVGKLLHSDRAAPAADAPDAPSSPEGSVTPFPPAASARRPGSRRRGGIRSTVASTASYGREIWNGPRPWLRAGSQHR